MPDDENERQGGLMPDPRGIARQTSMGMTRTQEGIIEIAVQKFGGTQFTIGMLCEAGGGGAEDCVDMMRDLHAIGAVRCPVNDGGCALYEIIPELVWRASRRR